MGYIPEANRIMKRPLYFYIKQKKLELVPPWAIRLVAEQEGVRYRT